MLHTHSMQTHWLVRCSLHSSMCACHYAIPLCLWKVPLLHIATYMQGDECKQRHLGSNILWVHCNPSPIHNYVATLSQIGDLDHTHAQYGKPFVNAILWSLYVMKYTKSSSVKICIPTPFNTLRGRVCVIICEQI